MVRADVSDNTSETAIKRYSGDALASDAYTARTSHAHGGRKMEWYKKTEIPGFHGSLSF